MNQDRVLLTKNVGVYRCPDDITHFKIRLRIRTAEDNDSNETKKEIWEEREFKWQEKVFNNYEREFYCDIKNCTTDAEVKYNEFLNEINDQGNNLLFSYVNEDHFNGNRWESYQSKTKLFKQLEFLKIDKTKEVDFEINKNEDYDYGGSLLSAIKNPVILNKYENMFIMADLGEYIEGAWVKFEHLLCTIKFNKEMGILKIFPDFTQDTPYVLQMQINSNTRYLYFIENASNHIPHEISLKEEQLFQEIYHHKASLKQQIQKSNFRIPKKNKLHVYLFFEIIQAKLFEYDNIHIQYMIDLPENWTTKDQEGLYGMTQNSSVKTEANLAYFGHHFDVVLEYDLNRLESANIPKVPYIYIEVVSQDNWQIYRTEGLCYQALPISKAGIYHYKLQCFRFMPRGPCGNLRRFFVGDCNNYEDLTWIGIPNDHKENIINKYGVNTVGTGEITLRLNVLLQSQTLVCANETSKGITKDGGRMVFEKLNSSGLIKSVEQVLLAFKKARENMLEARKKAQI